MLTIEKYSFGVGDRFAHQAKAQLASCVQALEKGVEVVPVWNKSHREHTTVGSEPGSVRQAADAAVAALGWRKSYYVDADHISMASVEGFLPYSDFFTIDVADGIGATPEGSAVSDFVAKHPELVGTIAIPGIEEPFETSAAYVTEVAGKYIQAVRDAGRIYRHIVEKKVGTPFVPEVSMDETDSPQTPPELLMILAALADEGIALQTIAPKFTGRFNKGVDYVGDIAQFEKEFNDDLAVIAYAIGKYGLPANLKLSVHSGSDKFSIYAPIHRASKRTGAGLHLKTAGTTWLEEIIGLAEADGDGLVLAKDIYAEAVSNVDALCAPYAAVIDIDRGRLPSAEEVRGWSSAQLVAAIRHVPDCPEFNPHMRQLLHVGYKIAAKMEQRYIDLLQGCEETIAKNVTLNLYERHIVPLFIGE
ncbi:MAG: hypothetical protein M2R45_04358 [Verrucomicrobia subdivision 3 bacterium]|nr:hypothetical protein [Limisphaerales bacterium]MCS1416062.1 hypothetical protein [Limisphaerales bacterium]